MKLPPPNIPVRIFIQMNKNSAAPQSINTQAFILSFNKEKTDLKTLQEVIRHFYARWIIKNVK